MNDAKTFLRSKTLGANVAMLIAYGLQLRYGFVVPAEHQLAAAAIINAGLRFATSSPVRVRRKK